MTAEEEQRLVVLVAARLGEHFDHVIILCSRIDDSGATQLRTATRGNYYAQTGMVQTFLTRRHEEDRLEMKQLFERRDGSDAEES